MELVALRKKAQFLSEWDEPRGVEVWLRQVSPHQSPQAFRSFSGGTTLPWQTGIVGRRGDSSKNRIPMCPTHWSTKITWHLLSRKMKPRAWIHSAGGSLCFSLSTALGLCLSAPPMTAGRGWMGSNQIKGVLRDKPTKAHHKIIYPALSYMVHT